MGRLILFTMVLWTQLSAAESSKSQCALRFSEIFENCQEFSFNGLWMDEVSFKNEMSHINYKEEFNVKADRCESDIGYVHIEINYLPYNYRNRSLCVEWRYERDDLGREWVIEAAFEEDEPMTSKKFTRKEFNEREVPEIYKLIGRQYDFVGQFGRVYRPHDYLRDEPPKKGRWPASMPMNF